MTTRCKPRPELLAFARALAAAFWANRRALATAAPDHAHRPGAAPTPRIVLSRPTTRSPR